MNQGSPTGWKRTKSSPFQPPFSKKTRFASDKPSTSVTNGKGTIAHNGKKVWQGPVKKDLEAFSKATSENENGQQKNTE